MPLSSLSRKPHASTWYSSTKTRPDPIYARKFFIRGWWCSKEISLQGFREISLQGGCKVISLQGIFLYRVGGCPRKFPCNPLGRKFPSNPRSHLSRSVRHSFTVLAACKNNLWVRSFTNNFKRHSSGHHWISDIECVVSQTTSKDIHLGITGFIWKSYKKTSSDQSWKPDVSARIPLGIQMRSSLDKVRNKLAAVCQVSSVSSRDHLLADVGERRHRFVHVIFRHVKTDSDTNAEKSEN